MSRGLGGALTLSILAHGGVVATIGVVGAAWLTGPRLAPPPTALYVDLVHPVVATSDRHEAADASPLRSRIGRPGTSASRGARAPSDTVLPPDTPVVAPGAPGTTSPGTASATLEVPRPPTVPVSPRPIAARPESTPPPALAPQGTLPPPLQPASTPPASVSVRMALPPTETVPRGPTADTVGSAPTTKTPDAAARISPGDMVDDRPAPLASAMTGSRASHDPGPGVAAKTGSGGRPQQGGAAGAGGQPAPAGGVNLARLPPGEGQGGSAPDDGIPPEYESYVKALRQRIQDRLVYPWAAVRRGQQGTVELELRLGPDGRLVAVEVVAGASAETLRVAAVAAVRGSAPFPFPPGLAARPLVIRLPVEFRLR
jgi:TonB family protein